MIFLFWTAEALLPLLNAIHKKISATHALHPLLSSVSKKHVLRSSITCRCRA